MQCWKVRQRVPQRGLEFYFLQQILGLRLVLPRKLQFVSQQIWIQPYWLAVAKPSNTANQFALYKDLEGYHSLWDTSFVPKQAAKKEEGLEELSQKYNFSPSYLKQNWASYWENFAGTEVEVEVRRNAKLYERRSHLR